MRNVLWNWVQRPDDGVGSAGLGECVVTRVKVLAFLEVLGKVVRLGGHPAVETVEPGFLGRESIDVDLGRVHFGSGVHC